MKKIVMIGAVLLLATLLAIPASAHVYVPDYENKYAAPSPDMTGAAGNLYVSVLCHQGIFSNQIVMQRLQPAPDAPPVSGLVQKEIIDRWFTSDGTNITYPVSLDGTFDDRFVPGTFSVMVPDGNNAQPEYAVVKIEPDQEYHVIFTGHAISSER